MKTRLIAAGLLAGLASTASAQGGQTLDGAQTFLTSVLPSAQMRLSGGDVQGWDNWGDILNYQASGSCGFTFAAYHEPSYDWENGTNNGTRNFAHVAEVSRTGSEVRVAYSDAAIIDYYLLTSESMATRVAYAMDFMRMNCDATASTGF
ncbi:MAG TPA: hypothetical protein VI168_17400 [Croceibacterium sp.]